MSGLVVSRVKVADLGPLRGEIDLGALDPGLTLITGDNETGKSTLVEGMRAALFENHAARHQGLKELQTDGTRNAPQVWLELSVGGVRYELHKRFLEQACATLVEVAGGTTWTGADAEARLQELLEANPAGKRGAKAEHMGVWGLLWVTQDEAAFTDPGQELPPEVRGRLQEAIGRQVATVLGGRDGEQLRRLIGERFARYFTPTGRPTGILAEHRAAHEDEAARVAEIEAAMALVDERAGQRESDTAKLTALQRDQEARQIKLAEAQTAAGEAKSLRAHLEAALAQAEARSIAADKADEAVRRRDALIADVAAAAGARQLAATTHEDLQARMAELTAAAHARMRLRLQEAEEVTQALAEAGDGISEEGLGELRRLHSQAEQKRAELEAVGTRVVVGGQSWSVGRQRTLSVQDFGEIEVIPAMAGLADAVEAAREAGSRLEEGLRSAGAGDLDAARRLRRDRVVMEVDLERLTERLAELAPDGTPALAAQVGELRASSQAAQAAAVEAAKLGKRRDKLAKALADNPASTAAMKALRELDGQAKVARSTADAIAPSVRVTALADIDVVVDDAGAASLIVGEVLKLRATGPTALRIGDLAEVVVEPGGEDLARAAAQADSYETERATALATLSADDLAAAEARHRSWLETQAALDDLADRQESAEAAAAPPEGDLTTSERRLTEAEGLLAAADTARVALDAAAVTEPVLERLEELASELTRQEAVVQERAARLDGVIITARRSGEFEGGVAWELIPGEGGAEADIAWARADEELGAALVAAGVDDLPHAEAAAHRAQERRVLQARLDDLTPLGLPALREEVAALPPVDAAQPEQPTPAVDAEQTAEVFASQLAAHKGTLDERTAQHEALDEELSGARERASDDTLRSELETAQAEARAAGERAEEARAGEAAGASDLLADDVARAQEAIDVAAQQERELRDSVVALDTQLTEAAAQGQFEELAEARAAAEAAADRLRLTEADAEATRLLHAAVDSAYAESQRRFLAPVVQEATPYLQLIRPGSRLRMSPDLTVAAVVRDASGTEAGEPWDRLSGGTREQLSVIVRLALARVLARDQRPLPLILDDTLGWTDDHRLEHMARILRNASKELQIIVLTCHPTRFHGLGKVRTIALDKLAAP